MKLLDNVIADLNDLLGMAPPPGEDRAVQQRKVGSLPEQKEGMEEVVFITPESFSQVQAVVDKLQQGEAVIVKLEEVSPEEATRIIDFVSGAIYALEGDTEKLGESIFLFTPQEVEISYE